ncbi:hypothetical protein ACIA5A_30590 [Micromonospora sp. NPDC051300]|uniref:hypothetical protein n=1 Tax=Micromonospora sp. NPDC051300 TaxID=3364286 RepID=UPI003798C0FC
MSLFRRQPTPPPDDADRAVRELLDRYHHRASIPDGADRMIIEPGQVLENFTSVMERLDVDIDTPVGVGDAASFEEVMGIIQMGMGSFLATHLVNTAMQIMSARYPQELVRTPLPEQYDLRKQVPALTFSDEQHESARRIFNQRTRAAADLDADDVVEVWEPLTDEDQVQVCTALFFMYGNKIGALKFRTGIK